MKKLCIALAILGLTGAMFTFTGCDKPKVETEKAVAIEQTAYAQDSEQAVKDEKKAEAPAVKQEAAKPEQAKAAEPKADKAKAPKKAKAVKPAKAEAKK